MTEPTQEMIEAGLGAARPGAVPSRDKLAAIYLAMSRLDPEKERLAERVEHLESLLWRAIDDASIDRGTWYAEATATLNSEVNPPETNHG